MVRHRLGAAEAGVRVARFGRQNIGDGKTLAFWFKSASACTVGHFAEGGWCFPSSYPGKKHWEHMSGCWAGVDDVEFCKDQPDMMVTEWQRDGLSTTVTSEYSHARRSFSQVLVPSQMLPLSSWEYEKQKYTRRHVSQGKTWVVFVGFASVACEIDSL